MVSRIASVSYSLVRLDHGVAVAREARTGRDELTDDDVLLEALEVVDLLGEGGFGEHAGGLLEGCGGQPGVGGQRRLGDTLSLIHI